MFHVKQEDGQMKIRRLKVKDLNRIKTLIEKNIDNLSEQNLRNLISSKIAEEKDPETEDGLEAVSTVVTIGTRILTKLLTDFYDEVSELFADLLEVNLEDYEEMDIDTPLKVIELIKEAPEVQAFFTISSAGSKMTELFGNIFESVKTRYGLGSAEEKENS